MEKVYKVAVIDDEENIESFFEVVQDELLEELGKPIEVEFFHDIEGDSFEPKSAYDIVVFDCTLNASNFMKVTKSNEPEGYTLIKKFREKNRNTKVILYSGQFDIENGKVPFDKKQFISIINDLNLYKITDRKADAIINTIDQAIQDIDVITSCMEEFYQDYNEEDVTYDINGREVKIEDLLYQLKMGGEDGKIFRKDIIRNVLHLMLKIKF